MRNLAAMKEHEMSCLSDLDPGLRSSCAGTSNMKFALNGGLILGTMDGANIEIADAIGRQNMFIFGATADETDGLRREMAYQPPPTDERLQQVSRIRLRRFPR